MREAILGQEVLPGYTGKCKKGKIQNSLYSMLSFVLKRRYNIFICFHLHGETMSVSGVEKSVDWDRSENIS